MHELKAEIASEVARAPTRRRRDPMLLYQTILLLVLFILWHLMVKGGILAPFFFGEPLGVLSRIWVWFSTGTIYIHLGVTLIETLLAFFFGTLLGLVIGLWLALNPF